MLVALSQAQNEPKSFVAGPLPQNPLGSSQHALGMAGISQYRG